MEKLPENILIHLSNLESPLGPMLTAATDKGICMLEFVASRTQESALKALANTKKAGIVYGENHHIIQLKRELEEYFAGIRQHFDVVLDPAGTDFQKKVWECLMTIPYGRTISYSEQAAKLGMPDAIRAIAASNGINKIAIVVPCHRVIGTNGKLTGYAGGLERKRWLINHEREHCSNALKPLQLF